MFNLFHQNMGFHEGFMIEIQNEERMQMYSSKEQDNKTTSTQCTVNRVVEDGL